MLWVLKHLTQGPKGVNSGQLAVQRSKLVLHKKHQDAYRYCLDEYQFKISLNKKILTMRSGQTWETEFYNFPELEGTLKKIPIINYS